MDWEKLFGLSHKIRNARIEAVVRAHLATVPVGMKFTARELAGVLTGKDSGYFQPVLERLNKMAPWVSPLAMHDGEKFVFMGRPAQRWTWYGQKT